MDMGISGIGEVVARARRARDLGESVVVATIVATKNCDVPLGARLVFYENGDMEGFLAEDLDAVLATLSARALREGDSRLVSLQREGGVWIEVRPQRGEVDVFLEVMAQPPTIVIVGAGHIAVPLAQLAALLDFRVLVLDDRDRYATEARFPTAGQILVGPYRETLERVELGRNAHVVLVTRGHVHDEACLEMLLDRDVAYIGMIGSRRRVRTVIGHLLDKGHDPSRVQNVFAPIGLDIGAKTPAEIALAIMAEIVNLRRKGRAPSLSIGGSHRAG